MKQDVGFVIVAYKPNPGILEKLQKSLKGKLVVLVDNTGHNAGFGGGANVGIRKAMSKGAWWVVVLNQDLQLINKGVKTLVEKLQNIKPGIAGPFAGSYDPKRWTTILPGRKVEYISGACMAIHKDVIKTVGYFHEPYFMYYEDADLCARAKSENFPMTSVPIVGIRHEETATLGAGSFLHQYYLARNHLLFVERNAPVRVKVHEALRLSKTIWEHVRKKERGALVGIRDYFLRRFGRYKPL